MEGVWRGLGTGKRRSQKRKRFPEGVSGRYDNGLGRCRRSAPAGRTGKRFPAVSGRLEAQEKMIGIGSRRRLERRGELGTLLCRAADAAGFGLDLRRQARDIDDRRLADRDAVAVEFGHDAVGRRASDHGQAGKAEQHYSSLYYFLLRSECWWQYRSRTGSISPAGHLVQLWPDQTTSPIIVRRFMSPSLRISHSWSGLSERIRSVLSSRCCRRFILAWRSRSTKA